MSISTTPPEYKEGPGLMGRPGTKRRAPEGARPVMLRSVS